MDTNIQFCRDLGPLQYSDYGIRLAKLQDRKSVSEIAKSSFIYDRFHLDDEISPEISSNIKLNWADNYFNQLRGDQMIVAEVGKDIVGFLQLVEMDHGVVVIDLIAVNQAHRGGGLAKNMIGYAIDYYKNKDALLVGTQLINTSSLRLYQKVGFLYKSSQYILHHHTSG